MVGAYKPTSLQNALDVLAYTDCTVFAGGTDLMAKRKRWSGLEARFDRPVMIISDIEELQEIFMDKNFITIGAACSISQIIDSSLIPEAYKPVFQSMAAPSIRNMATLGGNICNASPAGDSLPLLYALNASLVVESCCRKKEVFIDEFIVGPGKTILDGDELVTEIKIPVEDFETCIYRKVGTRKANSLSKLSFIGLVRRQGEALADVRIALGAVAPKVVRCRDLEQEIIEAQKLGFIDVNEILKYYTDLIKPIGDQRSTALYRQQVAERLLADFLGSLNLKG